MSKAIETPLEKLRQIFDSNKGADGTLVISKQLAEQILAAPVVERQDIQDWAIDHSAGRPILTLKGCSVIEAEDAAYVLSLVLRDQSPPAPVAVVLPDRKQYPGIGTYPDAIEHASACNEVSIWNACLDKVKELNP